MATTDQQRTQARPTIQELTDRLRGRVVVPGDAGYDAARSVWNGMIDRRPALIVMCAGVGDVMAAVTYARAHDLPVAVRGGGHNVAGTAVCDDGVVVDVSGMRGVRVDPARRTVWAQAGCTWGTLTARPSRSGWRCRAAWCPRRASPGSRSRAGCPASAGRTG